MFSPTWIAERLHAEGLLSAAQYRAACTATERNDERMEEALLRVGAIDELSLLRFVAEKTRTQYVSTEKLARVDVGVEALRLLSQKAAEKLLTFPIQYDRRKQDLMVVSPDAGNPEHVKQIAIATGARHVRAFLARPAAVLAAIRKWYQGEIQAFAGVAPETFTQLQSATDLEREPAAPPAFTAVGSMVPSPTAPRDHPAPSAYSAPPEAWTTRASSQAPGPSVAADRRLADLAEMLNVLVALHENTRDQFRGHSASVARLSRQLTERMGLDQAAAVCATVAANLHDLGKPVAYHLTAINLSQYATHRSAAQRLYLTPLRLLESIDLPAGATGAVAAMYERFDGQGFPSGLSGKDLPIGARVLALCDAYSDLTLNPSNPYRRMLTQSEALGVLAEFKGRLFDPDVVDLLIQVVAGENLRRQLVDQRAVVLLVEPAPEEATIFELRLVAQGFDVKVARTADQALEFLESAPINHVLSEVDLQPFDGFELLARLRRRDGGGDVPFVFVARASDTATIDRAFALGAQDYVVKPTSGDVLAAKLRRFSAPRASPGRTQGISGSLDELPLPDLTQVLSQGRKTGCLRLRLGQEDGEIHFEAGQVVHAAFRGLTGDGAFYALLAVSGGSFSMEPSEPTGTHTITAGVESLVLEGLRRLDEQRQREEPQT
jgi:response regulator RpfG family c-di-GMP phosphodiesterase